MTRGESDTTACQRRQKATDREPTMGVVGETVRHASRGRSRPASKSLDAQGSPEQHDRRPPIPLLPFRGALPAGGDPPQSHRTHLPLWACGWEAANPASEVPDA